MARKRKTKRKSKGLITIIVLIIVLFAGVGYLFKEGYLRLNYPSRLEYPVQGIDVSHHQGTIDWKALKNENMQFAFIKSTEGRDFVDSKFRENWKNAKSVGIKTGAYHFYRFCTSGKEQAQLFIKTVPNEKSSLPPVIDLEYSGVCNSLKHEKGLVKEIKVFVKAISAFYGKPPILYTPHSFYDRFLKNDFSDCTIWIRDIRHKPTLSDQRPWKFWQFANRGQLEGIKGNVDINVFNGSKADFERFILTGK